MLYFYIFVAALLLNLYVLVFGKADLVKLQGKISVKAYLREASDSLSGLIGEGWATIVKIVALALCGALVIFNAIFFLCCLAAVVAGTFAAKKAHQVPVVSSLLNRFATYINRLRNNP